VHCVIIGFHSKPLVARATDPERTIYESDGTAIPAKHINAYLVDGPDVIVESRNKALCDVPQMVYGNKPVDGGNLIIDANEYEEFIAAEPLSVKYVKRLIGAKEFLHNIPRYCLWLKDAAPSDIAKMPLVRERIMRCREMRLSSRDAGARQLAMTPGLFRETNNPQTAIIVPCVSSERREYIPIGFIDDSVIVTNANLFIPNATRYHFGVLTSRMHNAWMRAVAGRLEMRYRYSKDIVYNNFVWPDLEGAVARKGKIEEAAQAVLDARAAHAKATLADLYDPLTMPPDLVKAHAHLDALVDKAYGLSPSATDAERVALLFKLYAKRMALTK
ncbi:MAG: type IIL restriction-modification enzyme MmeI, partial [Kiritimatiellia bacterium]